MNDSDMKKLEEGIDELCNWSTSTHVAFYDTGLWMCKDLGVDVDTVLEVLRNLYFATANDYGG